jgi:hypothetical protein
VGRGLILFGGFEEGFDLYDDIILKLGRQFIKEAYHALEFFTGRLVKHLPRAVLEPCFTDT